MDLYPNNPTIRGRLLAKRQNPYTQIFKAQPSNPASVPITTMNHLRNDISATQEDTKPQFFAQNSSPNNLPPNSIFQTQAQISSENIVPNTQSLDALEEDNDEDGDDAPCFEKIEKKVKRATFTVGEVNPRRGNPIEEEKEESDHSTACETRSENFTVQETGDFPSPAMNHQSLKDPTELKLDDSYYPSRKGSMSTTCSVKDSPVDLKKVQEIINKVEENLAACDYQFSGKQKIKCKMGHQMEIDLSSIAKPCSRCYDQLNECREFAKKHEGICLNKEYEETIQYRCSKGHCWNLNYKNARRRWCAQCSKEQRTFLKKKCEEEKVEREKQEEESQKKLFEEARKKAMEQNNAPQQPFQFSSEKQKTLDPRTLSTMEYLQRIDFETENLAKKYSIQFMSQKEFGGDMTYQQILQVYKILIMPEQVLQTYM